MILKIDLAKAYDKSNWIYIRMLLTYFGFHINFINWVMCCTTSTSFIVLVNVVATKFFDTERGIR